MTKKDLKTGKVYYIMVSQEMQVFFIKKRKLFILPFYEG